jgi:hypothetical protein
MRTIPIDKPVRLTWDFLVAYFVLAIPTLWIARPWSWGLPAYSEIIGTVLLPFLAVFLVYCPMLFALSIVRDYSKQKRAVAEFFITVAVTCGFYIVVWACNGFEEPPSWAYPAFCTIASYILRLGGRRVPNQAAQPTTTSVTPPAGQEARQP